MVGNVHQHLTAATLLIIFNLNSQSLKVHLSVDHSRQSRSTNLSVNDSFEVGWSHIPNIAESLIKFQFNLVNAVGDISNFYTNNHLNVEGTLLSGVFMQSPPDSSAYPTLDPEVQRPLEIYLYRGSKFGYMDSGSLAGLANFKLTELYQQNYPACIHKLSGEDMFELNHRL